MISRRHAILYVGERVYIEDLGSQNGVRFMPGRDRPLTSSSDQTSKVLERRLAAHERVQLRDGSLLQIGSAVLSLAEERAQPSRRKRGRLAGDDNVVIADPAMRYLYDMLERVSEGELSVLLLGESGVGKEVFAQRVHRLSPRHSAPFLGINCGAFTPSLLESELFGFERGAFTGANRSKPGLLEAAAGGVVFLDEIGEMPLTLQVKLLRVLEERTIMRLGSVRVTRIDVRFVSATNRDLEAEIAAGRFRRDLYYRLNGISLRIPPLRERKSEILPLTELFLHRFGKESGNNWMPELSADAREVLTKYNWPGNIRELKNVIERAVILSRSGLIEREHLTLDIREPTVPDIEPMVFADDEGERTATASHPLHVSPLDGPTNEQPFPRGPAAMAALIDPDAFEIREPAQPVRNLSPRQPAPPVGNLNPRQPAPPVGNLNP
ncbi:MAG: sigma 54-interacting transcriptional regulator, partial [Myxococcota bacterium]